MSMNTKKLLPRIAWFIGGFLTAFVLIAVFCRYPPSFSEEQFDAIKEDMTKQEVLRVIGCPPGDYRPAIWRHPDWYTSTSDPIEFLVKEVGQTTLQVEAMKRQETEEWLDTLKAGGKVRAGQHIERFAWMGRDYDITVIFNKEGRIIHRSLWSMCPPRPPNGPIRYVQWWLGW